MEKRMKGKAGGQNGGKRHKVTAKGKWDIRHGM